MKFVDWPAGDQAAWTAGCQTGDPFDDPRPGAGLRPATLEKTRQGYCRWLTFLSPRGWLDQTAPPLARITRPRLRHYFQELKARGNADKTIIGRFEELERAARIMAPGEETAWIRSPDGVSVFSLLPKRSRTKSAPDAKVLFDSAITLMEKARGNTASRHWPATYRDGLLLAMLASRGRRLRSMAALRIGQEIISRKDRYQIVLQPEMVKTAKADTFDLPERLTSYVDFYLRTVRPLLLRGQVSNMLWISAAGTVMAQRCIANQVVRRTKALFGSGFGPHRCRHAIATTAVLRDPAFRGLGPAVLGISSAVSDRHYRLAGSSEASARYADLISRRRKSSPS